MGGDEACIAELGTILASMEEEPWYDLLQPEFSLFLMTDGIIYYTYKASEDDFDTKALQADYKKGLSAANGFDPEMSEMDYRSFKSSQRFQYTSDDFSNKVKIYRPENYTWKISY